MRPASNLDRTNSDIAIWHGYDPAIKAELYSTCLATPKETYLIDPIPLQLGALDELTDFRPVAAIIVTNSNHHRAAVQLAQQLAVPIFAHRGAFTEKKPMRLTTISDGEEICDGLHVIGIEGAAPGEIALHHAGDGGTLIFGDALINFEPYGFTFLPVKYCSNQKQMRRSLRKILDYRAERIFFAHGTPILTGASKRFLSVLDAIPGSTVKKIKRRSRPLNTRTTRISDK